MLEIGSLVDGKYKILNKVGHGGMSVVYLAMNEKANKQWAIKEVRKDGTVDMETVKQNLVAETDMLKKLSHPNLPSIVDVIEDDERFLIVMDYIQGNSLNSALEEYGAQPQEDVIKWAKQLCDVLGYLHTRKPPIIYRDMKPANVMLKPDGNVTLIDFGTAREFKEKNLADTRCLGTVGYAAPEQFGGMGQTDARTDIYCLGATLYHLVTGKNPCEPPYEIKPIREINSSLSSGFERIILKCTQKNPEDRYQSAAELMYDLEHYEEIDDEYRKKLKKRLFAFAATLTVAVGLFAGSFVTNAKAAQKLRDNYDNIVINAVDYNDCYTAIMTSPEREEAYKKLNELVIADFNMDAEEGRAVLKLKTGLDKVGKGGYSERFDALSVLKENNPEAYQDISYLFGESYLFYYTAESEKDRYDYASKWFAECKDKYKIASIYCDMAECLNLISQYNGAKIKQTEKMYEEYGILWEKLKALKDSESEVESVDSKLLIWGEINKVINTKVVQMLEVTDKESLTGLLQGIYDSSKEITKSVLIDDVKKLQSEIALTLDKIGTAK